jgi:hypothetical protein
MDKKITCFIPFSGKDSTGLTIQSLQSSELVAVILIAGTADPGFDNRGQRISFIKSDGFSSTGTLKMIAESTSSEFILIYSKPFPLDLGRFALERMVQICEMTGAGMVYSGYYENKENKLSAHPLIDYQEGSLRDDFNFGSVILYKTSAFRDACSKMSQDFRFAGIYDLRLKISQEHRLVHIPELLYTEIEPDTRKSGEKQFDYVDPRNRAVQIEMEQACTNHLKSVNAWLKPEFRKIAFDSGKFEYEASVIIPVKNRAKTVGDAITSVLSQETKFKFNLIVVDNYSTDGTTEILRSFAKRDKRVIHVIPGRKDLGIGGCWNEGVFYENCGKFAIQLDSDDLFIHSNVPWLSVPTKW